MRRGLVAGTFLPPHAGDLYLIDVARARCDELTVLVRAKPEQEIPGELRAAWLRELEPDVEVLVVDDTFGRDLGRASDVVFTSGGDNGDYAHLLGAEHVSIDSSAYGTRLPPPVRAYYVPRVVVAGAESTGKTTLAQAIAAHFDVPWVAEYGREYTEVKYRDGMLTDAWRPDEFVHIAREQERREDAAARNDVRFVVGDTDAFVTRIWYERYLGEPPHEPGWPLDRARERIYLVPEPDVAFVQDRIRDGEQFRVWMHARMLEELARQGREVHVLRGDYASRTREAIALLSALERR